MNTSLTTQELRLVQSEFKACDRWCEETDVIFVYPTSAFKKDVAAVTNNLQRGYEYLLQVTPVLIPPNQAFGHRLVVGYRHHQVDENKPNPHDICPGYADWQHRINVPWYLLTEAETQPLPARIEDQPEFSCSHELVHPFECVFLKNNPNKKWKEGFCDGLRAGVLAAMGMPNAQAWEKIVLDAATNKNKDEYHDAAGRILGYLKQREPAVGIRSAIQELISGSMNQRLDANNEIRFSR
jgi:hypothetical protein